MSWRSRSVRFDSAVAELVADAEVPIGLSWPIEQDLWSFKIPSACDYLQAVRPYTLANIMDQTKLPTWVASSADVLFFQVQSRKSHGSFGVQGYSAQIR